MEIGRPVECGRFRDQSIRALRFGGHTQQRVMDSMLGLALLRRHVTGIPDGLLIPCRAFKLGELFERIALRLGPGRQGEADFQGAGETRSDLEVNRAHCRLGSGDEGTPIS